MTPEEKKELDFVVRQAVKVFIGITILTTALLIIASFLI